MTREESAMTRAEFKERIAAIRAANPAVSELYVLIRFFGPAQRKVIVDTTTILDGNLLVTVQNLQGVSKEIPYQDIASVDYYHEG